MAHAPRVPQDVLSEHDVPCPQCGYNLRELTRDTCPECGRPFDRAAFEFVSPELGLESLTQTWLAFVILLVVNILLVFELRHTAFPAAAGSAVLALFCVVRSVCLLLYFFVSLPCMHVLADYPEVEHRRTNPDRWTSDVLGWILAERASVATITMYWRIAWGATAANALLLAIGRVF